MKEAVKKDGTSKPKKNFWHGVKSEFKKITWPDKESLMKQTAVVVGVSLVLGALIAVLDFIFQNGIDLLISL